MGGRFTYECMTLYVCVWGLFCLYGDGGRGGGGIGSQLGSGGGDGGACVCHSGTYIGQS